MLKNLGFNQVVSKELILLAQQGDIDSFEQIYRLFASASYTLSYRICQQHVMAEDIVHDAFIKIMNNIKQYNHKGSFAGWCRRVIAFESISIWLYLFNRS